MNKGSTLTHSQGAGVLAALRALATRPCEYFADALLVAEAQACLLVDLLSTQSEWLPNHLTDLIPGIAVEQIDIIPVAGTAFWGRGHWSIHLRAADTPDAQRFTVLHELKHIIDHPLRGNGQLTTDEWEAAADHFARTVMARLPEALAVCGAEAQR